MSLSALLPTTSASESFLANMRDAVAPQSPGPAAPADRMAPRQIKLAVAANPMPQLTPPRVAPDERFPRNVCMDGRCGAESNRIWNAFQTAGQVDTASLPRVFSGDMHWLMSGYDQNHVHHGGILVDRKADGSLSFAGRFSFFAESDPYATTTVDQARAWSAGFPVQRKSDYLYVNCHPGAEHPGGGAPMEYWLRQDATTHKIYIVAFWGDGRFGLGELRQH